MHVLFGVSPPKNRLVSGSIPDRGRVCVHVFIRFAKCVMFGVHLDVRGSGMAPERHQMDQNDGPMGPWGPPRMLGGRGIAPLYLE